MKLYCTVQDLIATFDENEIKRLSNRSNAQAPEINQEVVDKAIMRASAEMSMYLTGKNITQSKQVPEVLIGIACDITRFYLHHNPRLDSAPGEQYKIRITQLKDIAKGLISPGIDEEGQPVEPETTIQFTEGQNLFRNKNGGLW